MNKGPVVIIDPEFIFINKFDLQRKGMGESFIWRPAA